MAWLFACFGYSKKRKRLKSSHKIHSQDKGIGSYQALESPSSCLPEDSEGGNPKPIRSNLKRRKQDKPKYRKKVRFDCNVIAYEPVQAYDDSADDNDDDLRSILAAQWEEQEQEQEQEKDEDDIIGFLASRQNSTGVKRERSCSFTYRYNNCYDEEDELASEIEDDLDEMEQEEDDKEEELETGQELETGRCVNPVLIPIENLNQWRAIKKKRWEIVA